jgi:uncharacterized protein
MKNFGDIMFTDTVKAEQERRGSRASYAKMTARPAPEGLSEREAAFIAARDSFYMASVTETGWPYVQHRGGPTGFLRVLSPTQLGFADYRGNKQYVSAGNFKTEDRASLFLMDYPNKARLKILARVQGQSAEDAPELAARLHVEGEGRVERIFSLEVEAFDWNCPQFITPRYTAEQIREMIAPQIEQLSAENEALKARLVTLEGST